MDVVTFLTSNLKTRCIWFQPCINFNGETQDCEVVCNHDKLVIKNLHGVVLFEPYLFEVERITDILFNCSHYNKEKNKIEYATLYVPDFETEIDEEDLYF